jgi:hypothetical protein
MTGSSNSNDGQVTAIIPTWNRRDLLAGLLQELPSQIRRFAEILVVDNGSADGSAEYAESMGARVIRLSHNYGFSHAVNRGIRSASTEWVAVLNNDVRIAPDWLDRLLDQASSRRAWFASGKLFNSAKPDLIDGAFDLLCRGGCAWRAGSGRADSPAWSQPREVFFVPFTAALFRRSLFDKAGLLDEEFESYLEDVEFGLRCAVAGLHGIYVPEATGRHSGSATLGGWSQETVRRISRNQLLLVAKHYPRDWWTRYGWQVLAAQLLWGFVAARHGAGWSWLKGKWEALGRIRNRKPASHARLDDVLTRSERDLLELQKETGFDLYWRIYFSIT